MCLATFGVWGILEVNKLSGCSAGQRRGSLWPAEGARPKAVKGWAPLSRRRGPEQPLGLGLSWDVAGTRAPSFCKDQPRVVLGGGLLPPVGPLGSQLHDGPSVPWVSPAGGSLRQQSELSEIPLPRLHPQRLSPSVWGGPGQHAQD